MLRPLLPLLQCSPHDHTYQKVMIQVKVSGLAESVTSSVPISLSAYATKDIGDTLTISSSAITAAIILFFIIVLQPPPGSKSNYYSAVATTGFLHTRFITYFSYAYSVPIDASSTFLSRRMHPLAGKDPSDKPGVIPRFLAKRLPKEHVKAPWTDGIAPMG